MKNKIWMSLLAALAVSVGVAACTGGDKGDGAPAFEDPEPAATQNDRMGRPAINTIIAKVLNTTGTSSDAFNAATPDQDVAAFGAALPAIVGLLHACPPASLAGALLPDVLTISTTSATAYLNGRALEDDIFDSTLRAVYSTNGGVSYCLGTNATAIETTILTDHIDTNDVAFGNSFPYMAPPH